MAEQVYHFPSVTLLITHYNRSRSLERLLNAFKELGCHFGDIVVSDDASKPEQQDYIKELQKDIPFRLIGAKKNKGLANNLNKGQDAVTTPLILYVQEDFVPLPPFPAHFSDSIEFMEERPDLDMIRYYSYFDYPKIKPFRKGFNEMQFSLWQPRYRKYNYYSDHPHLRRKNFLDKFGRYVEGIHSDKAEYLMMMSFLHKKGKGLLYEDINGLFEQKNSSFEPSTVKRNFWREDENFIIANLRHLYRHIKFNFDYLFRR